VVERVGRCVSVWVLVCVRVCLTLGDTRVCLEGVGWVCQRSSHLCHIPHVAHTCDTHVMCVSPFTSVTCYISHDTSPPPSHANVGNCYCIRGVCEGQVSGGLGGWLGG